MPAHAHPEDIVFLAGSGRSGTTWLANLINHRQDHCYYFEPLNLHQVKDADPFVWQQYLRPDGEYPGHRRAAERFLYGSVDNPWVNRLNRAPDSPKRLVKEIRAHFFLGWLRRQFPEVKLIFILRHPMAVTLSRLEMGWLRGVDLVIDQPELREDHLQQALPLLERPDMHPYENNLLLWCVENVIALKQIQQLNVHVLFFEHLALHPEEELRRLHRFLGRDFDPHILETIDTPSHTSSKVDPARSTQARLEKWKSKLPSETIEQSVKLLSLFTLDQLYDDSPLPKLEDASVLSRAE